MKLCKADLEIQSSEAKFFSEADTVRMWHKMFEDFKEMNNTYDYNYLSSSPNNSANESIEDSASPNQHEDFNVPTHSNSPKQSLAPWHSAHQ